MAKEEREILLPESVSTHVDAGYDPSHPLREVNVSPEVGPALGVEDLRLEQIRKDGGAITSLDEFRLRALRDLARAA